MLKSFKYFFISIFTLVLAAVSFISCDGNADIKVLWNGGVSFEFEGNIGGTFRDMMETNGEEGGIDTEAIKTELLHLGFSNVKVATQGDFIRISFIDEKRKSPLFSLGIISEKNSDLIVSITPDNFLQLYNDSGEELQSILDLFLSPVLNEEVMTEEDYVDTICVTYGEDAGKEIADSVVRFNITNKNGSNKKKSVFVKKILCGDKIYF